MSQIEMLYRASRSRKIDASAAKYGLIVAAISLAILTVAVGIGSNLTAALGRFGH